MSGTFRPLTLGTAGHVDHGKTALVRALTGVETDRLPEERARGLTIVLGYAPLALPSGRRISVVDVPGHERFVRTMVAGATGIDAFLMVIAADDGVMPQTIEHATALRALDVRSGLVAITKADLASPARAEEEAASLLPGCPVVACSARTGSGVPMLLDALDRLAGELGQPLSGDPGQLGSSGQGQLGSGRPAQPRSGGAVAQAQAGSGIRAGSRQEAGVRLHVDRCFTVAGRGTVLTGTLWSGRIAVGDALELARAQGGRRRVRVRGLQIHDVQVDLADAGQRLAVNVVGIRREEAGRGDVLLQTGLGAETRIVDCALELDGARHGERVQVHHGTRDVPGRLCLLGDELWQLRLERPLLALAEDRLVVRRLAPPDTLGGGVILDAEARRHGARPEILERLRALRAGEGQAFVTAETAEAELAGRIGKAVAAADLVALEKRLRDAGPSMLSEAHLDGQIDALRELCAQGRAVRVSGRLYAHADVAAELTRRIVETLEADESVTLAGVRDALGLSRKSSQAFLEHLDSRRVTRRRPDDTRMLIRRGAGAAR